MRHRQRLQQDRVNQSEYRGVRANAQRQRQHRHRGKSRAFSQLPQSVTYILKKSFYPSPPRNRPHILLHQRRIPKRASRRAARLYRRDSRLFKLLLLKLQLRAQLLTDLFVFRAPPIPKRLPPTPAPHICTPTRATLFSRSPRQSASTSIPAPPLASCPPPSAGNT